MINEHNFPSSELLKQQAEWLAPARTRALRKAGIAQRRRVLDLGCGFGAVTEELRRRSGGEVVALDWREDALTCNPQAFVGAERVCGDALRLPFGGGAFDLVFCQFTFLWIDAHKAVEEIHRALQPGGVMVAIEPDYGGMIEHPAGIATKDLWINALTRAGADPLIGRKLPGLLPPQRWSVDVDLLDRIVPPSPVRFRFLEELPLSGEEKDLLERIKAADAALDASRRLVHLPVFIVIAERKDLACTA
jgi:SAM-dependent methyltransferase